MDELREKLAFGFEENKGALNRLYELETILQEIEENKTQNNDELKERVKNEIKVIRFDIATIEGTIRELYADVEELNEGLKFLKKNILKNLQDSQGSKTPNRSLLQWIAIILLFMIGGMSYLLSTIEISIIGKLAIGLPAFSTLIYILVRREVITHWLTEKKKIEEMQKRLNEKWDTIKDLERQIYFVNKSNGDKKVNTGYHGDNRKWLEEHFEKLKNGSMKIEDLADINSLEKIKNIKGKQGSENLLAKQLAVIYEQEFGFPISEGQIKGMIIYKDR